MSISTMGAGAEAGARQFIRAEIKSSVRRVYQVFGYQASQDKPILPFKEYGRPANSGYRDVASTPDPSGGRTTRPAGLRICPHKAATFRNMPISFRQLAIVFAVAIPACGLGGCGTINEKLADGMGEYIPQWAGGLPADAPPRPGTAKYDELMRERERKRLEPAAPSDAASKANASLDPVH
jgi:hypothetical protein